MSGLLVTLAVMLIVLNGLTSAHFGHGPGHHHPFGNWSGHHHHSGNWSGHHHPFGNWFGHPPEHRPGHGPGCKFDPKRHLGPYPGSGHNPECHGGAKSLQLQEENAVNEIRKKYAEVLNILNNSCRNNSIVPQIVYRTTSYIVNYNVPETKGLKVTVTIQDQILATQVVGTGDFKGFSDVRVLPDNLDVGAATWMFQGSDLKILIPYKARLSTLVTAECTPGNGPITEVKSAPSVELVPRMGDDN